MPRQRVSLNHLVAATNVFVDPWRIPDLAPTGLQVRARPDTDPVPVKRVALGVSATTDVISRAGEWEAELLVTHHGMFWGSTRPGYDPTTDPARPWDDRRVALLRQHGVSLASWHIPLDAHAEIGNNVELARRLGLTIMAQDYGAWPGTTAMLGVRAAPPTGISAAELGHRATAAFGQSPIVVPGRPEGIRSVGIVSGGATRMIHEVIDLGLDAWVCGEAELWSYDLALDAGLTLIVTGHHVSERYGVQALGSWLTRRFAVEVRFFDEPNPF